jgi:hypothetical protein
MRIINSVETGRSPLEIIKKDVLSVGSKKIALPVIIHDLADGGCTVTVPAISETVKGESVPDGLLLAESAIGKYIVENSTPENIEIPELHDGEILSLIAVDVSHLLAKREKLSVKRSVTIPRYLVEAGREAHLNFSKVLTDALKNILEKD